MGYKYNSTNSSGTGRLMPDLICLHQGNGNLIYPLRYSDTMPIQFWDGIVTESPMYPIAESNNGQFSSISGVGNLINSNASDGEGFQINVPASYTTTTGIYYATISQGLAALQVGASYYIYLNCSTILTQSFSSGKSPNITATSSILLEYTLNNQDYTTLLSASAGNTHSYPTVTGPVTVGSIGFIRFRLTMTGQHAGYSGNEAGATSSLGLTDIHIA